MTDQDKTWLDNSYDQKSLLGLVVEMDRNLKLDPSCLNKSKPQVRLILINQYGPPMPW